MIDLPDALRGERPDKLHVNDYDAWGPFVVEYPGHSPVIGGWLLTAPNDDLVSSFTYSDMANERVRSMVGTYVIGERDLIVRDSDLGRVRFREFHPLDGTNAGIVGTDAEVVAEVKQRLGLV